MCERDIQMGRQTRSIFSTATNTLDLLPNQNRIAISYWGRRDADTITVTVPGANLVGGAAGIDPVINKVLLPAGAMGKTGDKLTIAEYGSVITGNIRITSTAGYSVYATETILDIAISPIPNGIK